MMDPKADIRLLAEDLQLLSKLVHDPATVAAKQCAPRVIQSITADFSLTVYAARELERYVCGETTQISNRRIAEIYYRVLCAGVEQLSRPEQDPNA
jgi:hypothetical protein